MTGTEIRNGVVARLRVAAVACWLAVALCAVSSATTYAREWPVVAAAASMSAALTEIAAAFQERTGNSVRLSFGSSGNLTRQIRQGAPYELFLSADEEFVRTLEVASVTRGAGRVYARGRVALFVPHASPVAADPELDDLAAALRDGRLIHLAIANPEHAPYGRAARDALAHRGLWVEIQGRLVFGENVAQAAQIGAAGSVQAAIVSQSMARSAGLRRRGTFVLLDEAGHAPLVHRMVLLRSAGSVAVAFYDFMQSPRAAEILRRHGFETADAQTG